MKKSHLPPRGSAIAAQKGRVHGMSAVWYHSMTSLSASPFQKHAPGSDKLLLTSYSQFHILNRLLIAKCSKRDVTGACTQLVESVQFFSENVRYLLAQIHAENQRTLEWKISKELRGKKNQNKSEDYFSPKETGSELLKNPLQTFSKWYQNVGESLYLLSVFYTAS